MFFIVFLLLSILRFPPTKSYKFPGIGKPFPELVEFLEILYFDIEADVFVDFAFENQSLYAAYSETQLLFAKQHKGVIALRFNMNMVSLRAFSEHVFHTDSLESLM